MTPYGPVLSRLYHQYWSTYALHAAPVLRAFFGTRTPPRTSPAVLDLGCGTGQLALHFLEAGYPVTGLDLSPDMLFWARRNCLRHLGEGGGEFLRADIRRFRLDRVFGLVVATYNTLNHLPTPDLEGCFKATSACLSPEGLALLDLNTRLGLAEWGDEEKREGPHGPLTVRRVFDEERREGRMEVSGKFGPEKFRETVVNWAHPVDFCLLALRRSGFKDAYAARADDLGKPLENPERERRVFLVATK